MKKNSLVIITNAFPFTLKESFIGNELPFLVRKFDQVILIPLNIEKESISIPVDIEVLDDFRKNNLKKTFFSRFKKGLKAIISRHLWKDIFINISNLTNFRALWYLIGNVGTSIELSHYLHDLIKKRPELQNALFYSYWLHVHAMGLALLKKNNPNLKIISRAHSYDIYEKEHFPFFIPLRKFTLKSLDTIFSISEHGKNYLYSKHEEIKNKLSISRLGVHPHFIQCPLPDKSIFSFVSCSFLVPVKQVEMIIYAIAQIATKNPQMQFKWDHLGGGILYDELSHLAVKHFPENVFWKMHGNLNASDVINFYSRNYVDLFISASKIEGIPVSMMEALAFGIPIIGPDVGGVSELITPQNGILIKTMTIENIAFEIQKLLISGQLQKMRKYSFLIWNEKFNSMNNFESFANELVKFNQK